MKNSGKWVSAEDVIGRVLRLGCGMNQKFAIVAFAASGASRQCRGNTMFAPGRWRAVRPTIFRGLIAAVW